MFSISNLNLHSKKYTKFVLSQFNKCSTFSLLVLYESSPSSDTGHFTFIQQNSTDGNISIKKLIWISESGVYSFTINPGSDWLAIALRGGSICILPLGALMSRVQRKCDHWKSNDITYLTNKIKHDSPVTCMKWWTSSKNKNTCLIGKMSGEFLIIDLANGSLLFSEQFPDHIKSIDLLFSLDATFSYCIITTSDKMQWKLLLEEVHKKDPFLDKEFGFEALDFSPMYSCCILDFKSTKKSKAEQIVNPSFVPTKLYQFTESTHLKSQSYNGNNFIGAYDRNTGKYKLFDCANLDCSLFEFQLPFNVVDICVTEELLFVIVGPQCDNQLVNGDIPHAFQQKKALKLCIICRQYAQSHLFEKYKSQLNCSRSNGSGFFKPSTVETVPNVSTKCVLFEFELDLFCADDVLDIISFPIFYNFSNRENLISLDKSAVAVRNPKLLESMKKLHRISQTSLPNKDYLYSKWYIDEMKLFTPLIIAGSNVISICYMSQCFEDKFIDCLLENDTKGAEWLGAGLRLDMNFLYRYTGQLLVSGNAQLGPLVIKSKRSLILEYFSLGSTTIMDKLACFTQFWSVEDCLNFALTCLPNINSMSPNDRSTLSNSIIPMFGYVMSDLVDSIDGTLQKKNKYSEKFRRFILSNCFFNDFKAAKVMIGFGKIEEAFFIAKEKGCVLEVFTFLMENNYNTNWAICFEDLFLREKYLLLDRDFVLNNIGLTDLEIIARNDPMLLKCFGEFIFQSLMNNNESWTNILSYKTITHLCLAFNPYGSIIDTLFHIYSCTSTNETNSSRRESELAAVLEKTLTSSTESLTDTSTFSKTLKIRREIGPELMAFCLLVISRDNQINVFNDHIYFIQLYGVITATADRKAEFNKNNIDSNTTSSENSSGKDLLASKFSNITFKPKKNLLSPFWQGHMKFQCLSLRHDLCISISIFEADLFEDDSKPIKKFSKLSIAHNRDLFRRKSSQYLLEVQRRERCQINMLGFQKDKTSRVLLLPKSIENGKEIIRQISLGKQHILILTDCGSVYGAGSNINGQLGIEKSLHNESSITRKNYRLSVINPQLVNMNLNEYEVVLSISTGDFHSGAIIVNTMDSEQRSYVATWGWGVHGQLGHNNTEDQRFPKRIFYDFKSTQKLIDEKHDEFPVQLTMGCYHTIFLTNKGHIYSFGNNSYGQLGIQGIQKSLRPLLVKGVLDVINVNTKYFHTVCSTISNDIFTWGIDPNLWQNQINQDKSHDNISTPILVDTANLLSNEKIIQISCGTTHTTILTESKLVYSFGANMWGQLGIGNRKEYKQLVEVKVPKPINFISSDNGITVGMNISEKITKLMIWGRCSHPLVTENLKEVLTDTVRPQLIKEYQHTTKSNFVDQNCFGIDALSNSGTTILNKHQLMIFFRNCSEYLDRYKLIHALKLLNEFDIISDFYLTNDMLIESLFWRIRSLIERISNDINKINLAVILEDIEIIFQFYIQLTQEVKHKTKVKAVLTMITGFFQRQRLPWIIYERLLYPLIKKNPLMISKLFIKYSLDGLTSDFIRHLLLNITEDSKIESMVQPSLGSIVIGASDIKRFHDLIKAGSSETIYDAADDHKVVFFAGCNHASVLGRYREQQVKLFLDKLRRKQLNFSTPMIQRLYNDSTIIPDCLECLFQRI